MAKEVKSEASNVEIVSEMLGIKKGTLLPDRPTVVESVLFHDRELEKQDSCINERWLEGWQYLDTTLISGCAVTIRFIQK